MKPKLALLLPLLLALTLAPAGAAMHYLNLANPSPTPPYTNWASAATNIQDVILSTKSPRQSTKTFTP